MQDLCLSAGQAHPCQPGRAQGVSIEYIAEHNCKNSVHFWTLVCLQVEKKQEAEATIGGKINGFNGSSKHTTLECPAFLIPCCVLSHCRSSIHTIYGDVFFFFFKSFYTHLPICTHTHTLEEDLLDVTRITFKTSSQQKHLHLPLQIQTPERA